jgi:hypothetical protein
MDRQPSNAITEQIPADDAIRILLYRRIADKIEKVRVFYGAAIGGIIMKGNYYASYKKPKDL